MYVSVVVDGLLGVVVSRLVVFLTREEKNWFLKATFVKLNERKGKKERSRKWVINEVDEMTGEKKLIY